MLATKDTKIHLVSICIYSWECNVYVCVCGTQFHCVAFNFRMMRR